MDARIDHVEDSWEILKEAGLPDGVAMARLRGIEARRELLAEESGTLTAHQVSDLLGISRQAVYKRHRVGSLLAVDVGRHGLAFPAWQFVDEGVLPGFKEVLAAFKEVNVWTQLDFFLGEHDALDGERPLDVLRRGELKGVLRAARLVGEQVAV